jgi:hypothetical protein
MGEGSRVRYSRASKCFVCRKPFEGCKNNDGTITLFYYRRMGDPGKYERLCVKCNNDLMGKKEERK